MSFFGRKFTGKNRARSLTESQLHPITNTTKASSDGKPGKNVQLEEEYASLRNSGRSKTNFRPVQHSTIAELDSFFGSAASSKNSAQTVNYVKDSTNGKVWYDTIEQQEWRKLLQPGSSPTTPPSRRSSSTSFLTATPGGSTWAGLTAQQRRRSIHSPLRSSGPYGIGIDGRMLGGDENSAPLSPLSELISSYSYSPMLEHSFSALAAQPHAAPSSGPTTPQQLDAAVLASRFFSLSPVENASVLLDLASKSPFSEQVQRREARQPAGLQAGGEHLSPKSSGTTQRLREALGLGFGQGKTPPSSGSSKAARRLSWACFPSSPLSGKGRGEPAALASLASNVTPTKTGGSGIARASHTPPDAPCTYRTHADELAHPIAPGSTAPLPSSSMAEAIDARMQAHATPIIQAPPSRAERTSRRSKNHRHRQQEHSKRSSPFKVLRRTSSAGDIRSPPGAREHDEGEEAADSRSMVARAALTLQELDSLDAALAPQEKWGERDSLDSSRPTHSEFGCDASSVFSCDSSVSAALTEEGGGQRSLKTDSTIRIRLPPAMRHFALLDADADAAAAAAGPKSSRAGTGRLARTRPGTASSML
ncbi:hypothetical protein V8E36_008699 [Tilletia maclaganii]